MAAWLQVLVGFLFTINTFGLISAFGVFQANYMDTFRMSPSYISWIGSTPVFLLSFFGTFAGRLIDAGYFYLLVVTGGILQVIGIFSASFAKHYWQALLSQGVTVGLGNGLVWTPGIWLIATHFDKKKGLAIGISSTGAPIGAVIFTVLGQQLIPLLGVKVCLRVMAAFVLLNNSIAIAAAHPRKPSKSRRGPLIEWSAFAQPDYSLFCVGIFFTYLAVWFVVYYIPAFGQHVLHLPASTSLTTLIIMNSTGLLGRILVPWLSDHFHGPLPNLCICTLFSASCIFAWMCVANLAGLEAFVAFYGFFWHALQTLFTAACASITTNQAKLGTRMGMCFTVVSFAVLVGPPVGGALVTGDGGGYLYAQICAGGAYVIGASFVGAAWLLQQRNKMKEEELQKKSVEAFLKLPASGLIV